MFQFFVDKGQIAPKEGLAYITGPDVNHISHVLRMKPGEQFYVTDGESQGKYLCALKSVAGEQVVCDILRYLEESSELPCEIVLYQGLPKADKMELIIQKAVELGVARIVPVATKRSVVKLDEKKAQAKISRWQGIAEAAAKQSKRDMIPVIGSVMSLKEALKEAAEFEVSMMPYENAEGMAATRSLLEGIRPGQRVAIFIGPEGGFDESEVEAALLQGTRPVTLGRRILRTETAGIAVLAMLVYLLED
ncbi:MAG: 16S rRNA (uracil(1498)-N(3))-methyltransferase [Lachnospiraceae bacterium]|nr:16S rRNA (uracil(1498)-N(3))-methyltransferase [Lachnospiraceae bacterium]